MSPYVRRPLGRRAFLIGGAAVLAGCNGGDTGTDPVPTPDPARRIPTSGNVPSPLPVTVHAPAGVELPRVRPWRAAGDEVEPDVKVAAARVVEALGTVRAGDQPGGSAADRLRGAGAEARLAERTGALVPPAAPAVVEIVYPQYGGLTTNAASVMTVARQTWIENDELRTRTVTADVRLTRAGGRWSVTELRPAPVADLSALSASSPAATLAGMDGLDIPAVALADLAAGLVDDVVVEALTELGQEFDFSVCVLRSGHPVNVFGTDRVSNHTQGRAADVWAIDGRPVVTMELDDPTLLRFLEAAREAGSDQVGGPLDLDGAGSGYFTDQVHRDHVHIGFRV